jgi:putative NADH-flavin reductase
MKLTIIAATGGVGQQLLAQARNPAKLPPDVLATNNARIVTSDLAVRPAGLLETAVAGADAVLSTLGPHNNSDAGIAAPGTRAIITAMRAAGGRRIVDSISLRIVVLFLGWLIS